MRFGGVLLVISAVANAHCAPGLLAEGSDCRHSSDCGPNLQCAYSVGGGCGGLGTCVSPTGSDGCVVFNDAQPPDDQFACVCPAFVPPGSNAEEVNLTCEGLPTGYSSTPILYSGHCQFDALQQLVLQVDAGPDGS
jgi:hypothetical protein